MSCPNLFVAACAREFLEEHLHREKHPHTVEGFWEMRPRFKNFRNYFLRMVQEFKERAKMGATEIPRME